MTCISGIDASKRLYDELGQFKKFLLDNPEVKLLVIDGDYFDHKLSITEPAAFYAVTFFQELANIAKERKITVRMVQGTRGHELNQLQLFKPRENEEGFDFRIIETRQEEDLYEMHILYLPEEYPEDPEEYYKEFKAEGKEYSIIFGHGTWDFVAQYNQIERGNQKDTKSAPVFIWKEWKHTVPNGFISFGHIHGRNTYGKKIFYSGAFTRWNYGERSARGFTYFEYDTDNKTYDVKYIDNTEAPKYDAITLNDIKIDFSNQNVTDIQKSLNEQLEKTDYLAVDLSGLSKENIALLKRAYAGNKNIKLEVKEAKVVLKESSTVKNDFAKFQYIVKRQLPLDETIVKYCKEELNYDIKKENVDKIIDEKAAEVKTNG